MVEIIQRPAGPKIKAWEATIFDATASVQMSLWQFAHDREHPIVLEIDGCSWPITTLHASRIVWAARSLDRAIDAAERDTVLPKARVCINHWIGERLFEIAIVVEHPYLSIQWGDVCLLPVPSKRDELLFALGEILADLVLAMRGSGMRRWSEDELAGAPPGAPPPGVVQMNLAPQYRGRFHRVGWDSLEAPTKRREMFPAYQGREFDDELIEQLNVLPEFVAACGFANAKARGFEADDFLAAAVAAEGRGGGSALVASGDRDLFQLASPSTTILYPMRAGQLARIGPDEVRQRYGVDPKQVPDFIALRGDPSDKLPGAAGVGPKRAAQLLQRYGSLNGVLAAGLFQSQAEMLRLYRVIATMDASAPLPSLADQAATWGVASTLARAWGFNQLADHFDGMA